MLVETLIDKAEARLGSRERLAAMLGATKNRVTDWKRGYRPCPLEKQVLLCEVAELTDQECRAHLREAAGVVPKLAQTLMGCMLAVGLFMAVVFAPPAEAAGIEPQCI